jgi:DNA-binding GntR family transcriptional regulator
VKLSDLRVDPAPSLIREQALENLRAAIISGYYRPGDRLIERELCEAMGVSRTSVREVLRRLEAERLVSVVPRKGPVVSSISPEEGRDIYEVRALLEGAAVRGFVRSATTAQVTDLRLLANAFGRASDNNDMANLVAIMSEFYDVLLDNCGNHAICDLLKSLHARISYLRGTSMSKPGRVIRSVEEINAIVDAIEAREEDRAWQACQDHVNNAAKTALNRLAEDKRLSA